MVHSTGYKGGQYLEVTQPITTYLLIGLQLCHFTGVKSSYRVWAILFFCRFEEKNNFISFSADLGKQQLGNVVCFPVQWSEVLCYVVLLLRVGEVYDGRAGVLHLATQEVENI